MALFIHQEELQALVEMAVEEQVDMAEQELMAEQIPAAVAVEQKETVVEPAVMVAQVL